MKEHLKQLKITQQDIKTFVLENQEVIERALLFRLPIDIADWEANKVADYMLKYYQTIKSGSKKHSALSELVSLLVSYHCEKTNIVLSKNEKSL